MRPDDFRLNLESNIPSAISNKILRNEIKRSINKHKMPIYSHIMLFRDFLPQFRPHNENMILPTTVLPNMSWIPRFYLLIYGALMSKMAHSIWL